MVFIDGDNISEEARLIRVEIVDLRLAVLIFL